MLNLAKCIHQSNSIELITNHLLELDGGPDNTGIEEPVAL